MLICAIAVVGYIASGWKLDDSIYMPDLMIIARGENPRTEKKLIGSGANKVVLPTAIGATKVAQLIIRPTAENMLEQLTSHRVMTEELGNIGLQFNELQVAEGSPLVDKSLGAIEVRSNHGFFIARWKDHLPWCDNGSVAGISPLMLAITPSHSLRRSAICWRSATGVHAIGI